jgi:F0F1-type ATP synthase membrane subunit b/b'
VSEIQWNSERRIRDARRLAFEQVRELQQEIDRVQHDLNASIQRTRDQAMAQIRDAYRRQGIPC